MYHLWNEIKTARKLLYFVTSLEETQNIPVSLYNPVPMARKAVWFIVSGDFSLNTVIARVLIAIEAK